MTVKKTRLKSTAHLIVQAIKKNRGKRKAPTIHDIMDYVSRKYQKLPREYRTRIKQTIKSGVTFGAIKKKGGRYVLGSVLKRGLQQSNASSPYFLRRRRSRKRGHKKSRSRSRRRRRSVSEPEEGVDITFTRRRRGRSRKGRSKSRRRRRRKVSVTDAEGPQPVFLRRRRRSKGGKGGKRRRSRRRRRSASATDI